MLPLDAAPDRRVRARAGADRPRGRLAGRARRLAGDRRRARRPPALARRRDRDRPTRSSRSTSSPDAGAVLLDVTPRQLLAHRRPPSAARATGARSSATATARASSSSTGRSTARSRGARRTCAPRRDGAPRRHARRDRRRRGGRRRRPAPGAPVRAARPAELFDPTRAPAGKHTAWAYCHVPTGSTRDMTDGDRGADRALRARLPRA